MRRAWVVLLASCGFHSPAQPSGTDEPTVDASSMDMDAALPSSFCWTISSSNPVFQTSACAAPAEVADMLDISSDASIDTDAASTSSGLGCVPLISGGVCALVARSIVIRQGVTLSAHGTKPLALLAHDIDVEGVIDVASHSTGTLQAKGPAADRTGCNSATRATGNGGGPGGTYDSQHQDGSDHGGDGGDGGGIGSKGGKSAGAIGITSLLGGCAGGPSSGGSGTTIGGHGGGAVWIAVDTGALVIGGSATINASGAGGAGGMAVSANRGGYGGGAGGLIVLQAPTITLAATGKIFATGGGGGGGSANDSAGTAGSDPADPMTGAGGGSGATSAGDQGGAGGQGFPAAAASVKGGVSNSNTSGGGGGGGGTGAIRVRSSTTISGSNVSPPPIQLLD